MTSGNVYFTKLVFSNGKSRLLNVSSATSTS